MFHIGSDTLCVATQKSGDTLAAPLPTVLFLASEMIIFVY